MSLPNFRVAKTYSGNSAANEVYVAGDTIVAGNPVELKNDGTVDAGTSGGDTAFGIAANGGDAGDPITVWLGLRDTIFSGIATGTATYADPGDLCDISSTLGIDLAASTDDIFTIIGPDPTDSGRYLVHFTVAESQAEGVAPTA